jgi:hypothetical protein
MGKMLCSLLMVCAFAGFAIAAPGSSPALPVVVARIALKNRNASIPTTALFTPKNDGLFRISGYAIPTAVEASGKDVFWVSFTYKDDAGSEAQIFPVIASIPGCNLENNPIYNCAFTGTVEVVAGNPLSYSVQICSLCSMTYNLYVTVEKLE